MVVDPVISAIKANADKLEGFQIHTPPSVYSYSDTQFEILKAYIEDFENGLDKDHQVGLLLTNFGQTVIMQVREIGYEESVVLVFKGYVNGVYSTLIQHVSQLNFLLTSVPVEPDHLKQPIGFLVPETDKE